MDHVDPHSITVIPATAKRFMGAQRYAVVGRIMEDRTRFDNQVLWWYQDREMPVVPVRPPSDKFDNSKPIEGLAVVESVVSWARRSRVCDPRGVWDRGQMETPITPGIPQAERY